MNGQRNFCAPVSPNPQSIQQLLAHLNRYVLLVIVFGLAEQWTVQAQTQMRTNLKGSSE